MLANSNHSQHRRNDYNLETTLRANLGASLIQQDSIGYPYLLSSLRTRTVVHVDQL